MNSIEVDIGNLRYTNLVYEVNRFYPVTKAMEVMKNEKNNTFS